jgi:hypothetical protein
MIGWEMHFQVSGLGRLVSGSGAGRGVAPATRHLKIVLTANRLPLTAKTCPLPLNPFRLITHAWPTPLCRRISVPDVISSVRWR